MKTIFRFSAVLILALSLGACVSLQKYNELEAEKNALQRQADSLGFGIKQLSGDIDSLGSDYQKYKSTSSKELKNLSGSLSEREKRLKELEEKLAARDASMDKLRQTLSDALLGFKESGLTVSVKDGKVYVSLSNQLLFASGKTEINKKGQEALLDVSKVLAKQSDINILVEGHTDNAPVGNLGAIKDNWDLSVLRSTEVIRYLTTEGALDAKRITASGHAEFMPLTGNGSSDGRAKNRRTELVLTPKLDELYDLMKKNK
ncbi:MAG: flagellar motor protein MotB [Rhizobacter sp.]|nr:flagellar motor protein MotB [Chlorobiales bacterium]